MRQLLHIFKKDIRGLWGELAVFLCSLVLGCLSSLSFSLPGLHDDGVSWGETIVLMAGCYLIARLIHAETIPGSNHFWLTRPYRWPALVGAKALFIFVSVHVPVFVAQAALLWTAGFPVWGNLPALLWMQVLVLACISLPAAAIAAVTAGLAGFALFVLGGLAFGGALVFLRDYGVTRAGWFSYEVFPSEIHGWVKYAILAVALVSAALPVLAVQYSRRKTSLSRVIFCGVLLTGLVLSLFGGGGLTWTIQALASTRPFDTSSFQFSLGTPTWLAARSWAGGDPLTAWPPASFEGTMIDVHLPLSIKGVDPASDLRTVNLSLSFEAADGETSEEYSGSFRPEAPWSIQLRPESWRNRAWLSWGQADLLHASRLGMTPGGERRLDLAIVFQDSKFYQKLRNKPSTVLGYIDLFVIGNERSLSVPVTSLPFNLTSAFRCGIENIRDLKCRPAFRWPSQWIDVGGRVFMNSQSFSPFPANLQLNPIAGRQPFFELSESPQVDFKISEPVSFVRKRFEIHDVQLIEGPATERGWRGAQ